MKDNRLSTPFSSEDATLPTAPSTNALVAKRPEGPQHRQPRMDGLPKHVPAPSHLRDVKHGKARMPDGGLSSAHAQHSVQMRSVPAVRPSAGSSGVADSGAEADDGPRCSKRRRLSAGRHEDAWEGAEDVRMLNKAFRAAEDALQAQSAENTLLREELARAKTSYERRESEVRQDLLFRHIVAREQATRDHEREKISLLRLVSFLKTDHEKHVEKLKDETRGALAKEVARAREALAEVVKQAQIARSLEEENDLQFRHMSAAMEHASALANMYEGDLVELQRLAIEESEDRDRDNIGLPPAYNSLQDIKGYRTPYGATRHRDAGDLDLNNIQTTVTKKFMIELNAANRASLALREHPDRAKSSGAGLLLYHKAMSAFASACRELRGLLEQAIENTAGAIKMQSSTARTPSHDKLPSRLNAMLPPMRSSCPTKLPSLSDLGIFSTAKVDDAPMCGHPIDLFTGPDSSRQHTAMSVGESAAAQAIIAATDQVSRTVYELCHHIFAALDVREHCPQRLWHNRCAHLGTWSRLADDTLLQCLRRRLEATVVEQQQHRFRSSDVLSSCSACGSEHCGGYCSRLQMLSYNINMLKAIRRGFDKVSSPTRAGMYFHQTWHWLKETLENERQISANTLLPRTRRPTPELTEEEIAVTNSTLDPEIEAVHLANLRHDPETELAPPPSRTVSPSIAMPGPLLLFGLEGRRSRFTVAGEGVEAMMAATLAMTFGQTPPDASDEASDGPSSSGTGLA